MSRLTNVARIKNRGDVKTKEYGNQTYRSSLDFASQMRVATEKAKVYVNSNLPESEMVRPYASKAYEEMEYHLVPAAGMHSFPDVSSAPLSLNWDVDWGDPVNANVAFENAWGEGGETKTVWSYYIGYFYSAVSGDDGYWDPTFTTGSWLQMGTELGSAHHFFARFPANTIPTSTEANPVVIESAYFKAYADYGFNNTSGCHVKIHFGSSGSLDSAVAPTSTAEANAMTLTTGLAWNNVPNQGQGFWISFPNIKNELQTIIDRPGRKDNAPFMMVVKENGIIFQNAYRQYQSFDAANKPYLEVLWRVGTEVPV